MSKKVIDILHELYLDQDEKNFRLEHLEAIKEIDLSHLTANLGGISFYNSIVVFHKKKRRLPKSELR